MGELDRTVTAEEYSEWMTFYSAEPFGDVRADTRAAVVASTFVRVMAGKNNRQLTLIDFMPFIKAQRDADEANKPEVRARAMMHAFESQLAVKVRRTRLTRRA